MADELIAQVVKNFLTVFHRDYQLSSVCSAALHKLCSKQENETLFSNEMH